MAQVLRTADSGSSTAQKYDTSTGTWKDAPSNSGSSSVPSTSTSSPQSNPSAVTSTTTNTKSEAEKKYIEQEFNVLTGDISVTPTKKSIHIKVNDTVQIEGLGKYLTGLYFVQSVRRTLTKEGGYSHSLTLRKNGFGSSVKKST